MSAVMVQFAKGECIGALFYSVLQCVVVCCVVLWERVSRY